MGDGFWLDSEWIDDENTKKASVEVLQVIPGDCGVVGLIIDV
jgi:hypothetical protein